MLARGVLRRTCANQPPWLIGNGAREESCLRCEGSIRLSGNAESNHSAGPGDRERREGCGSIHASRFGEGLHRHVGSIPSIRKIG